MMIRFTLPLIIIVCITFSLPSFTQNKAGDDLFNGLTVHTINIKSPLPLQVFWDSLIYYKDKANQNGGDDTYMRVDITIDNVTVYDIGAHLKGNSSYNAPNSGYKKSFKLDFDKYVSGQDYDGLDKLNLNNCIGDPTMMREKLTCDLFNNMGLPSSRSTFANLYLNDTLWGIYSLCEIVEGTFLKSRFGEKDGNLFKGDHSGHMVWEGSDQTFYYGDYELENNDSANDWSDLVHLLDIINNTTDNDFKDSLETVLNTETAIKYWAICNLLVNLDSYLGSGHNYYIYHNISTNQFEWIPWDVNESIGGFSMNGMPTTTEEMYHMAYDFLPSGTGSERPLYERMLDNITYTKQYTDALYELISTYVNEDVWNPRIDSIANVIRPYVYADSNFTSTIQDFETNLTTEVQGTPGLKMFIKERTAYYDSVLMAMGYPSSVSESISAKDLQLEVYPNPAQDYINIQLKQIPFDCEFMLYTNLGERVMHQQLSDGEKIHHFYLGDLPAGIYSFTLNNHQDYLQCGKIVCVKEK